MKILEWAQLNDVYIEGDTIEQAIKHHEGRLLNEIEVMKEQISKYQQIQELRNLQFRQEQIAQKKTLKDIDIKSSQIDRKQAQKTVCPLERRNQDLQIEELKLKIDQSGLLSQKRKLAMAAQKLENEKVKAEKMKRKLRELKNINDTAQKTLDEANSAALEQDSNWPNYAVLGLKYIENLDYVRHSPMQKTVESLIYLCENCNFSQNVFSFLSTFIVSVLSGIYFGNKWVSSR